MARLIHNVICVECADLTECDHDTTPPYGGGCFRARVTTPVTCGGCGEARLIYRGQGVVKHVLADCEGEWRLPQTRGCNLWTDRNKQGRQMVLSEAGA